MNAPLEQKALSPLVDDSVAACIDALDWQHIARELDTGGCARCSIRKPSHF
jgi:hypothetical protein